MTDQFGKKKREEEEQAQRAHEQAQASLKPASEQKVRTAPLVVNMDKQNNQSAVQVASRIPNEDERDNFLESYRDQIQSTKSPNHQAYVPSLSELKNRVDATIPGGVYQETREKNLKASQEAQAKAAAQAEAAAQTRGAAMQSLSGLNLMGFDGQAIDINTADPATVVRGINSIADSDVRAQAAKLYKTLTQTEGSRFYGENTDGVGTFLESANLTQSDYKEQVSYFNSLFYGDGQHGDEDAGAYLEALQEIESGDYSAYVKSQLTAALDKAYTGITGSSEKPQKEEQVPEEPEKQGAELPKEKKPGFFEGLLGQVPGAEENAQLEGQDVPQDVPQGNTQVQTQDISRQANEDLHNAQAAFYGMAQERPEIQGPVQMTAQEQIVANGGMSFAEWMAAGAPGMQETQQLTQVDTVGEAAQALLSGHYDEVEGAGKDELDRMLDSSAYARRMIGTLTEGDSAAVEREVPRADIMPYMSIASQGQTIKTLYDSMMSDSFPEELRGVVMAQMIAWASQAEKMEEQGTLGGDPELPLLERLLTTDEHAMDELASTYAARDELLADKAQMRRELEEQNAQTLEDARTAALKGTASEEQLALVRENADVSDAAVYNDNGYWTRTLDIGAYFAPEEDGQSAFSKSSVKLSLDAQGVIDTSEYESALYDQMSALLEEDTRTALALGMSLEDYYAKTGGVDMNALCERAASRISRQGAAIGEAEMAALDAPYGQGVGGGYMFGAGIRAGGEQWFLDFKDSLYVGWSQGMVKLNAAKIQDRYQNAYGAYGRTQYRKDIEAALNSGTLDENYAAALRTALTIAADPYQLGIDPRDFEGNFLKNSAEIRRDIETMENYMRQNATEDEYKWFGRIKGMTYNVASAGAARVTTLVTGNPLLGFITGYSVTGFKGHFDEYLQKGYSINSAKYMSAVNTGLDLLANYGFYEATFGRLTGMSSLTEGAKDIIIRNPAGASKGLAAIQAFGTAFRDKMVDEVIHDPFFEGLGSNWTENALGEIFRKIDAGEDISFTDGLMLTLNLINPENLDIMGAAQEIPNGAVENAIGTVIFALADAKGAGVGTLSGVKAAQDLMNGKRTDVDNVLKEVAKTLGDEQSRALLNDYALKQKEAQAVAQEVVSGKSENGSAEQAAKAKEQAEQASREAAAAQTAADNSHAQFEEAAQAVADGDLTRQKEMSQARVREGENQKTANEQGAVAERRTGEMEQAQAQRMEEARQKAAKTIAQSDAADREAIANDRQARIQAIEEELSQLSEQEETLNNEFAAAMESYNDAVDMGMDEDTVSQLDARMDEIATRIAQLEERKEMLQDPEAYTARQDEEARIAEQEKREEAQWQQQQEQEHIKAQLSQISQAVKDIKGKKIYLNDKQVAEVLHYTGLRTVSQVNSQYGTKFRVSENSQYTKLDGGFFDELIQSAPGMMDAQSVSPEVEVLKLLDRGNQMQSQLYNMQASVGKSGAEAYLNADVSRGNLDPVTQKLASVLKKRTGLELIVMPLANDVRGFYDRENGRLFLSNKLGAGEMMRQVVMHELTHFTEGTKNYAAYEDAALEAAYHGDMDAMERDADELRAVYEKAGVPLKPEDVHKELVAAATEKLIDSLGAWGRTGSETLIYDLLGEKQSFPIRVYNKLTQFLARRKAQKAGGDTAQQYKALETARDRLKDALTGAGEWKKGEGAQDVTVELFGKTAPETQEVTKGEQTEMQFAVGLRQFGNKNAQEMDTLTDAVKDFLNGSEYEKVTNREQVQRANDDINARGIDTVVNELLAKENWTADDHAKAAVALVRADNEGYQTTAYMIAEAYDKQGTNSGQALQARKIAKKLTTSGALVESVKKADHANAKKGLLHGDIPVGDQAPVKGWKERQQKARENIDRMVNGEKTGEGARGAEGDAVQGSFIEALLPPILEDTYTAAEQMQRRIDKLPTAGDDNNPWHIGLAEWKSELIDQYRLRGTKLPGDTYSYATVKERQLAAIIAASNDANSDARLALCQQLEAMKRGLAVVTEADLNYIAGQMSTFLYAEGTDLEGMPVTTEGKTALQRVYNAQANTVQDGMTEKINAFGYTNMLSSPKTWSKNFASNALIRPLELASEKVGGVIEKNLITPKTGNRTTDAPTRAERAAGKDAFTGEIGQTMVDYFVTHADTGHGSSFDLNRNNRTYSNEFLQAYKNIVDFAMQIGDRPYWEQCYAEELAVIKRLGTRIAETRTENGREVRGTREMTLEEMKNEAAVRATERVFQEDNNIVNGINKARRESPLIDFVLTSMMPFLKTPTNVASRMMQYSPVGLARAVLQYGLWDGKRNGGVNFDQRKFVMNLGRGLTGTGLAAVGCLLASVGAIQPGREDEEDKRRGAIRKAQGESYSTYFKLGDMEIPLDFAQPSSGPLYIGAKIAWGIEQMGDGVSAAAILGDILYGSALETGNQLFDNSFLSGFSSLFSGYNDVEGIMSNIVENIAENQASRLTPSVMRAFAKATDPYVRDVYSQNAIRQFINQQIIQNWALLRQTLPIKTDITGDKTLQNGYYNWGQENQNAALHFLNAYVTPWTTAGEKNDAVLDELLDLSYKTDDTGFLPGELVSSSKYEVNITKTLAKELKVGKVEGKFNQYEGFTLRLTDEEKRWVNETYADTLFNGSGKDIAGLRALTQTGKWARMSDDEKISAVEDMQKKAKKQVLSELVRRKKEAGEIK